MIFAESGSSSPSLTSSATLYRPDTRASGSSSSKHILRAHRMNSIGRFQPCASFGFFQIGHLPFIKITFLDTCQKMVSTHAPQFRSNLFCSEINSNHPFQRLNGSLSPKQTMHRIPILPLGKGYKYQCLLSRWHFHCSILCLLLCSRTHLLRRRHRSQNTL